MSVCFELDPNHVETLNNLGVALQALGLMAKEAAASFANRHSTTSPTTLRPTVTSAMHSRIKEISKPRSLAIGEPSRSIRTISTPVITSEMDASPRDIWPESVRCRYERPLELKPGNPEMHLHRAWRWLQMGDFERGWAEYEWRLQSAGNMRFRPIARPRWDGQVARGTIDSALRRPRIWEIHDSVHPPCSRWSRQPRGSRDRRLSETDPARAHCELCGRGTSRGSRRVKLVPEFAVYAPADEPAADRIRNHARARCRHAYPIWPPTPRRRASGTLGCARERLSRSASSGREIRGISATANDRFASPSSSAWRRPKEWSSSASSDPRPRTTR